MRYAFMKNKNVILACINTTLNELYDFKDALDQADIKDSKADTFGKIAAKYEEVRRRFIDDCWTDQDEASISVILNHRFKILLKKQEELDKAIKEMETLVSEISDSLKN